MGTKPSKSIVDLSIFSGNSGLDSIKKNSINNKYSESSNYSKISGSKSSNKKIVKSNVRGKGAPIKHHDPIYATSKSIKLSVLLNSISRNLNEKYETELTRDEILRKALNDYIKQNMTKEDKEDLLKNVIKDLDIYRFKNPIIPIIDEDGTLIRNPEDIAEDAIKELKENWGMR